MTLLDGPMSGMVVVCTRVDERLRPWKVNNVSLVYCFVVCLVAVCVHGLLSPLYPVVQPGIFNIFHYFKAVHIIQELVWSI